MHHDRRMQLLLAMEDQEVEVEDLMVDHMQEDERMDRERMVEKVHITEQLLSRCEEGEEVLYCLE